MTIWPRGRSARLGASGVGFVLLASLLAACGSSSGGGGSAPSSYSLGAAFPLSGEAVTVGDDFQRGSTVALKLVNAAGGIDGKKLSIDYADNQLTAQGGVTSFDTLTSVHGVQALIQTSSAAVTSSAPLATRSKVLMLNPGAEDPDIQNLSPYIVSDIPSIKYEINDMLPYLYSHGYRRMVMYGEGDSLGQTSGTAVNAEWTKLGGTYLGTYLEPISVVDHSSVISKIKSLNPDIVYLICGGTQAGTFIQQARAEGLKVQMAGASPLQTGGVLPVSGAAADGILDTAVTAPLSASNPAATKYETEFQKLYPTQQASNIYSIYAYDAVMMYVTAAKYLVSHKISYNGTNLRDAMLKIKNFTVASGSITIESDGSSTGTVTLYKIDGNNFVPMQTFK
jgi:branched-chain amino acid transport system substrate-binding protein